MDPFDDRQAAAALPTTPEACERTAAAMRAADPEDTITGEELAELVEETLGIHLEVDLEARRQRLLREKAELLDTLEDHPERTLLLQDLEELNRRLATLGQHPTRQ